MSKSVDPQKILLGSIFDGLAPEGHIARNPVTGGEFVVGVDRADQQIATALSALKARKKFAAENPDFPPLPITDEERAEIKFGDLLSYGVSMFGASWLANGYRSDHPSFDRYFAGLLASEHSQYVARELLDGYAELARRFPPRRLASLGPGGCWSPSGKRKSPSL